METAGICIHNLFYAIALKLMQAFCTHNFCFLFIKCLPPKCKSFRDSENLDPSLASICSSSYYLLSASYVPSTVLWLTYIYVYIYQDIQQPIIIVKSSQCNRYTVLTAIQTSMHWILTETLWGGVVIVHFFQVKKGKHREIKELAQNHTANIWKQASRHQLCTLNHSLYILGHSSSFLWVSMTPNPTRKCLSLLQYLTWDLT